MGPALKQLVTGGSGVNAYTVTFDPALLGQLCDVYNDAVANRLVQNQNDMLAGRKVVADSWEHGPYGFHVRSYGHSPLLWVSTDNLEAYGVFNRFFCSLDIADDIKTMVDFERDIVLYCGFFVVSDHIDEPRWHVDYFAKANAFTLITPLFDLESCHGRLLYCDSSHESAFPKIKFHSYRRGEAIVFGEGFPHSTEPYQKTPAVRVLVSLSFGTDKLEYWEILERTVGKQSNFVILPCGHRNGTCSCLDAFARSPPC